MKRTFFIANQLHVVGRQRNIEKNSCSRCLWT